MQVDRLPEAVSGCVEPRGAERPAADPDGGARALLRAAPPQDVLLRLRRVRRVHVAADDDVQRQRRAELVRVAAGQLRVAAAREPGAEAGDLADAGAADGAGAGAGPHEAAGHARRPPRGARPRVPGIIIQRHRADRHVRAGEEAGEEDELGWEEEDQHAAAAQGVLRL